MKQKGRLFFGCVLCAALVTLGFLLNVDRDEVIAAAEESHVPPVKEVFSSKPDVAFVATIFRCPLSIMINRFMINIRLASARKKACRRRTVGRGIITMATTSCI